ncbi:MAG TPA: SprB repeat-containing protein, partial [Chitinophagales bacterium]|nr:SprB repeat-containing protein [Chitinophagales bacterium]
NAGATAMDGMNIQVYGLPTVNAGPDVFTCQPQVQLSAAIMPGQNGAEPVCSGTNLFAEVGHDTLMFPFIPLTHPGVLSAYAQSYRNQMLYTAAELTAAMGGAHTINKIGFNVTRFGSSAFLQGYTIRMTSTSQTTLTAWTDTLIAYYATAGIAPVPGWNIITLANGFAWDGVSNVIVDICMYAPNTFGNQPNDVACSLTPTNSYLYSYGSADQCSGLYPATASNLRPNIRFGYCDAQVLPYTINWSPANVLSDAHVANPMATLQSATTFQVTVTGAGGCTATDAVNVNVSNLQLIADSARDATCAYVGDGKIYVHASGGAAPYTYSVNGGPQQQSGVFTGLFFGSYLVMVQDGNGCTDTLHINLNSGYDVTGSIISQTLAGCLGGSVTLQAGNGTAPYEYSLDMVNYQTSPVFTNVQPGSYTIVMRDANGCRAQLPFTMNLNGGIEIVITNDGDGVFPDTLNAVGHNSCAPYTYNWSNGATTQQSEITSSGSYSITVSDCDGCTASLTVSTEINATVNLINVTCNGLGDGRAYFAATGGIPPYQYSIDGGSTFQSSPEFTSLVPGQYTGVITDAGAAYFSYPFSITQRGPLVIDSVVVVDAQCIGINNGSVCIYATGDGIKEYFIPFQTSLQPCFTSLPPGSGIVSVTDSNNCQRFSNYVIEAVQTIDIDTVSITPVSCYGVNDGGVHISVSGGTPAYNYTWSPTGNGDDLTGLSAGAYSVTAMDMSGCYATGIYIVNQPTQLQLSAVVTNVDCYGSPTGAIDLTASGGTPAYNYNWNPGNIFIDDPTGLAAGTYNVTVMDMNGCYATASYVVSEPSHLQISSITTTNVTCYGAMNGSACVQAVGGAGTVTYMWNTSPAFNGMCITNIPAGSYGVTVYDGNACSATGTATVTEPAQFTAYLESTNDGLLPDTLLTIYSGGIPPYSFLGSNATTVPVMYIDSSELASCFSAMVTDSNGCSAYTDTICYDCVSGGCVWPGDADNNGIADNNDLLPIGLAYGTAGIYRYQQGTQWLGYIATNWPDTLADGTNYKHIDCNGNGIINADDTLAIIQNYGLVHNKTEDEIEWRMNAPALLVELQPDTTQAGDTMYANVLLGDANMAAANVYGLAFTINYDVNVVDTLRTRAVFGNSWLGTVTDKISIAKDLKQGQIKCAVTRIDHISRTGAGQIGQATFVITTDNINGKNMAYYKMHVWLSDVMMIDNLGQILEVNA